MELITEHKCSFVEKAVKKNAIQPAISFEFHEQVEAELEKADYTKAGDSFYRIAIK